MLFLRSEMGDMRDLDGKTGSSERRICLLRSVDAKIICFNFCRATKAIPAIAKMMLWSIAFFHEKCFDHVEATHFFHDNAGRARVNRWSQKRWIFNGPHDGSIYIVYSVPLSGHCIPCDYVSLYIYMYIYIEIFSKLQLQRLIIVAFNQLLPMTAPVIARQQALISGCWWFVSPKHKPEIQANILPGRLIEGWLLEPTSYIMPSHLWDTNIYYDLLWISYIYIYSIYCQ